MGELFGPTHEDGKPENERMLAYVERSGLGVRREPLLTCDFCGGTDELVVGGRGYSGRGRAHPGCEADYWMDLYESQELDRPDPPEPDYPYDEELRP